jgi:hypothetical protein
MIPVLGPGKQAIHDFQQGRWGWGLLNTALAVSDVFLGKAAVTGIARRGFKAGSHTWKATRAWYGGRKAFWEKIPSLEPGTPVHHWAIEKGSRLGKRFPALVNQPWNLMPTDFFSHMALHNSATRMDWFVHGTPGWFKPFTFSVGSRGPQGVAR